MLNQGSFRIGRPEDAQIIEAINKEAIKREELNRRDHLAVPEAITPQVQRAKKLTEKEKKQANKNPLSNLVPPRELKRMLEQSQLNSNGFFNPDCRKETSSVLMQTVRALSPNSLRLWNLECQYGGTPKKGQLVRVGHLSKFSEMIDGIESVALQKLGFENYMSVLKKCTEQTMYESSAKYAKMQ